MTEQATRQKVKDLLTIETRKLITELTKLEEQLKNIEITDAASATTTKPPATTNRFYEIKLTNYGKNNSTVSN